MSYGFEIFDNQGTPVVESHAVLHTAAPKDTATFESVHAGTGPPYLFFPQLNEATLTVDDAFVSLSVDSKTVLVPPASTGFQRSSTTFAQLGGAHYFSRFLDCPIDLPGYPARSIPSISGNISSFRSLSPTPGSTPPAGTYGMQIFNGAGTTVFDSRFVNSGIAAAFIVPKAKIEDVLVNNAVVNITLPKSMPSCWVSSPFFAPLRVVETSSVHRRHYHVRVSQTSNTNIRLARHDAGETEGAALDPGRSFYHDAVIYVARSNI